VDRCVQPDDDHPAVNEGTKVKIVAVDLRLWQALGE
jgi:hypothetical protein